jgi:hypothetical protein
VTKCLCDVSRWHTDGADRRRFELLVETCLGDHPAVARRQLQYGHKSWWDRVELLFAIGAVLLAMWFTLAVVNKVWPDWPKLREILARNLLKAEEIKLAKQAGFAKRLCCL